LTIPPDSKEIRLFYVLEGISALDEKGSSLKPAKRELLQMKENDLSIFGLSWGKDGPLLKLCRFEKLRFFTDPERKQPLCADRHMTIIDRDEFAKILNTSISHVLAELYRNVDEKEIQSAMNNGREPVNDWRKEFDAAGAEPALVVLTLAQTLDVASIKLLMTA